jgi:hypothetical protein
MPEALEGYVPSIEKDSLSHDKYIEPQVDKDGSKKEGSVIEGLTDKEGIAYDIQLAGKMIREAMEKANLAGRHDYQETFEEIMEDAKEYFFDNHCSTKDAIQVILMEYGEGSRYKGDKKSK